MSRFSTISALVNASVTLALYLFVWGVPTVTIAALEVGLAAGAGFVTWYALKVRTRGVLLLTHEVAS